MGDRQLEQLSDTELFKRRADPDAWSVPVHREAIAAEIHRRELERLTRATTAATRTSWAAIITSLAALLTLLARFLGFLS